MKTATKATLGILAVAVGAVTIYFGYDSYAGKKLVRELCAKDGGLKIYETAYVPGFLDETQPSTICSSCFERLVKKQFEYIDRRTSISGSPTPIYFRYSLAARGDPRCDVSKRVNQDLWEQQLRRAGVANDQCVALEPLGEMPDEPVLTLSRRNYTTRGPLITEAEWAISRSGQVMARIRQYAYFYKTSQIFNWAPSNAALSCTNTPEEKQESLETLMTLLPRVLRADPSAGQQSNSEVRP